jgi:hypothetical protein
VRSGRVGLPLHPQEGGLSLSWGRRVKKKRYDMKAVWKECYILYAYKKEWVTDDEVTQDVPIIKVIVASSDVEFFQKNRRKGKTPYGWFLEWVLDRIKRECPCVLVPFSGDEWEFFVELFNIVVIRGEVERVAYLPVVDLSHKPK